LASTVATDHSAFVSAELAKSRVHKLRGWEKMGGVLQELDSESSKREQDVMACNRLRCKMPTKEWKYVRMKRQQRKSQGEWISNDEFIIRARFINN
jgi:hypothetical protein